MRILDFPLWFFLYSFVGWAWETALFTVQERRFINRGFLIGPFCPIYGFGALLLLLVLENRVSDVFALFFIAVFLTTALEYLTAVILENLFQAEWWDYSMFPLNYKGRISVISSAVFGLFAVLQIKLLHPFVRSLTDRMPVRLKSIILFIVIIYLFVDITLTLRHIFVLNGRLSEIQGALNAFFGKYYKRAGELKNSILVSFEESEFYSEQIKTLFNLDRIQNRRMIRAFPKLRSFLYDDALKKLKARVLSKNEKSSNQDDQKDQIA
ncbi:MAG: putative ABC transporter permease [Clostridiales bacterium]|nr:putative ABC transporter permease [Clostridiales bacterium]